MLFDVRLCATPMAFWLGSAVEVDTLRRPGLPRLTRLVCSWGRRRGWSLRRTPCPPIYGAITKHELLMVRG